MKQIFIGLLLTLSGTLVSAAGWNKGALEFTCVSQADASGLVLQAKLKQLNHGPVYENRKVPFALQIAEVYSPHGKPVYQPEVYRGHLITEDVVVDFNSSDKKVNLRIYLDELEETILQIKGQKDVQMTCLEHRW